MRLSDEELNRSFNAITDDTQAEQSVMHHVARIRAHIEALEHELHDERDNSAMAIREALDLQEW